MPMRKRARTTRRARPMTKPLKRYRKKRFIRRYKNKYNARTQGSKVMCKSLGEWFVWSPSTVGVSIGQKDLAVQPVSFPASMADPSFGNILQARCGQSISLRGIKCDYRITNHKPYPIEYHWALVQLKDNVRAESFRIGLDLFVDPRNTQERFLNFTNADLNDGINPVGFYNTWDMGYLVNPINSSQYNVLSHKRKILGSKPVEPIYTTGNTRIFEERWMWKISKFFKLNKTINFDRIDADGNVKSFHVLMWWLPVYPGDLENPEAAPPAADGVNFQWFHKVYFRDL